MASGKQEPRWRLYLTDAERERLAEIEELERITRAALRPHREEARKIANRAARRATDAAKTKD